MDSNSARINEYLKRFDTLVTGLSESYTVESMTQQVHVLHPKTKRGLGFGLSGAKDVALTISALIHGVEIGGLAVLVELLELVTRGQLRLEVPLGISLGNVPAAHRAVRFIERDLNRSFGRVQAVMAEERRADELEKLFTRTEYLLDIHQVKLQIDRPFWIFPYTKKGYQFARAVAPDVSVITHWGRGFSDDGQCSDEWVNRQGGAGVTIELGQNGFVAEQIRRGVDVCLGAVAYVSARSSGQPLPTNNLKSVAPLYTWGEIIPYPPTGKPVLHPGWHNFKTVKAGDAVGTFNGADIKASVTGPVLFPKYPDLRSDGAYGETPPAAELIRVLREISESELPTG